MFWHIDTDIVALIVTVALLIYTLDMRRFELPTPQNRGFLWCLYAGVLMLVVDIASSHAMDSATSPLAYHILMTLYPIAQDLAALCWLTYSLTILYHDDERMRRRLTIVAMSLYAVYTALALSNPWTGLFFTLSPDMVYACGPLFLPLMIGLFALYTLEMIFLIIIRRKHIPQGYPWVVLFIQPVLLTVSIPIQLLNSGLLVIMPAYMICLVLAFLFFQNVRVQNDQMQLHRFAELVENFSSGVAICDVTAEGRLKMRYISSMLAAIYDETPESLMAHYKTDVLAHVHPEHQEEVRAFLEAVAQGDRQRELTFRIVTDKGMVKWVTALTKTVDQSDATKTIYITYVDLTEQKMLQKQLSDVIRNLPSGICIYRWDGEDLHPIMANSRYSEMLGTDAMSYLQSNDPLDLAYVHPDDIKKLKEGIVHAIAETKRFNGTYRSLNARTGKYIWVSMRGAMMPQEDGTQLVLVSHSDVTAEHETERQLREREQELWARYELERKHISLGDENMLVHAIFNLTTGETLEYEYRDGSTVPESERTALAAGRRNAGLIFDAEERWRFLEYNDRDILLARFNCGETEMKHEYRKIMPTGEIKWIRSLMHLVREPRANDVLLFEYWYDIDEQKMRELTYRSIVTDNYEYAARIDGRKGSFVVYPKAGQMSNMPPLFGDNADAATERMYSDGAVAEDRDMVIRNSLLANVRENLRSCGRFQFTYREREEDGSIRYKKITQYYIDRQREIIIMLREDVTELIRSESEKNAILSAALDAANRASAAKSQFLSRVSHELRTPLNAIIGFMELSRDADQEQTRAYLSNSETAAKQLLSVINDVLDVSTIESNKMKLASEPFNMTRLLRDLCETYQALCRQKGLSFESRIDSSTDGWFVGDELRLNQVLMNLLSNAVKFTTEGFVRLTVSRYEATNDRVFIHIAVSDSGCGISDELRSRLFRPFEQESAATAQKYGGNGLGLSIVGSLVSMMDGSVRVESVQGAGSTFMVELPFERYDVSLEDESALAEEPGIPEGSLQGMRVLLAEDNSMNRTIMERILQKQGVLCDSAEDGQVALDMFLSADSGYYDAILMDIQMPNMDGFEATKCIRASGHSDARRISIIAVTANAFNEDIARSLSSGMDAHISKPVDIDQLKNELYKACSMKLSI